MTGWLLAVLVVLLGLAAWVLHRRSALHWLPDAAAQGVRTFFIRRPRPVHVLFGIADHFEPSRDDAPPEVAAARLAAWLEHWPEVAAQHRDSEGLPPKHTWFYPWDEWRDGEVAALSRLCYAGLGEVELHLHHHDDTAASLQAKLAAATAAFGRHGALLHCGHPTQPAFGFVHGDWALANSHPTGAHCGVDDELAVLAAAGCYADFTLPAPDACQPRWVNQIVRAALQPGAPRSHEVATPAAAGQIGEGLLLVPGPLGINLRDWTHGYPTIDRAELAAPGRVRLPRVDFWVRCGVGVRGRPDWVFVKLHTHGCHERDQDDVLGAARHQLHRWLSERYDDGDRYRLHYGTARELANWAMAAESGYGGDPSPYRDLVLPPPVNACLLADGPVQVAALSEGSGELHNLGDGPVHWALRVGPVAQVEGHVRSLRWNGSDVQVAGEAVVTRR